RPPRPQLPPGLTRPDRTVLLGPDGRGAHEDHVGQPAQHPEHPLVGLAGQPAGQPLVPRGAVGAGHHVEPEPRPALRVGVGPYDVWIVLDVGMDATHTSTLAYASDNSAARPAQHLHR